MKARSFFGHRNIVITDKLVTTLKTEILRLLKKGFDRFYFGGFGMFDCLCWQLVTELKFVYHNISRVYCLSDPKYLRASKRPNYLKDGEYEEIVYLDLAFDYWYTRIYYRNCEMIKQSDFVIFYAFEQENSGAFKAYKYAKKIKKDCVNLGEQIDNLGS